MRRPRRGRRFLTKSRYSLLVKAGRRQRRRNELRRVAARRRGWRRTARLCESQKLAQALPVYHHILSGSAYRPFGSQEQYTIHRPIPQDSSSVQADEACGAHSNVSCGPPRSEALARATRWVAEARPTVQPNSRPKVLPRVSLTAAPLSLCRIGRVPTGRICPLSGRATEFLRGSSFFSRALRDSSIFGSRRNI